MKKFDPITVLGSALCILAMAGILLYNAKHAPAPQPAAQAPVILSENGITAETETTPAEKTRIPENLPPQLQREPALLAVPGKFQATVDTMGRGVKAIQLEDYAIQTKTASKKENPVVMGEKNAPFLALDLDGTALYEMEEPECTASAVRTHRTDANQTLRLDESWEVASGAGQGDDYSIRYSVKFTNLTEHAMTLPRASLSSGALPDFLSSESNTSFSKYLSGCVAYGRVGKDDAKTLDMKAITKKMDAARIAELMATPANWVAVSSKYFLFALREPAQDGQPAVFQGFSAGAPQELYPRELFSAKGILPAATLQPGESRVFSVKGYAGPKSYQLLEPMGHGISSILNMDLFFFWHCRWMGWLCKMLLMALNGIAGCFDGTYGYGIAIILITVLVKLVFMPLVWRSTRSMKKMSAVQPQLKALREKYKDDPQRMYYEQQKLFKENGVSQTGGCLPMLVQIPVFFAMFNTFRGAIEIRNASFLWVADLSMPDPVFGLPIHPLAIMTGVTMYLQQRLQPMPDPNQAKMMNIMSLVFVFFFYNMPAGLTLYMTINQLTSILQMLCFRKMERRLGSAAPSLKK